MKTANEKSPEPVSGPSREMNPAIALMRFSLYVIQRFLRDQCQQRASGLTFTALLAMVPLLAVSFALFSAFPAYESLKGEAQSYIFENFVPQVGTEVQSYLEEFTAQTGRLSAVGICFLAVTAVMLLLTISNTFNQIWGVQQTRGLVARLLVFWAVLTLAPMLFGASISLSSVLFTLAQSSGVESYTGNLTNLAFVLPFLFQAAGLTVLYLVMPNYPVRRRDAVIGGLVSACLLELLKKGFALYVTSFPTYQTIYGVMATIPIFLIWVYVSWMVVLLGAECAASLPEWRAGARQVAKRGLPPVRRLTASLAVLNALARAAREGRTLSERRLAKLSRLGPEGMNDATTNLTRHGYITRTDKNHWVLGRDLDYATLADLYSDLGLAMDTGIPRGHLQSAWGKRFAETLDKYETSGRTIMSMSLKNLLAPPEVGEEKSLSEEMAEEGEGETSRASFNARVLALVGLGTLGQAG